MLSDRLRAGSEAAPWVIPEVEQLEGALRYEQERVAALYEDIDGYSRRLVEERESYVRLKNEKAAEIAALKADLALLTDHGINLDRLVAKATYPELGPKGFVTAPPELVQFRGYQWVVAGVDQMPDFAQKEILELRFYLRQIKENNNDPAK